MNSNISYHQSSYSDAFSSSSGVSAPPEQVKTEIGRQAFEEGKDSISSYQSSSFSGIGNNTARSYLAPSQHPVLQAPNEHNYPTQDHYGPVEQGVIADYFFSQVNSQLDQQSISASDREQIFNAIKNGQTLSNPSLNALKNQILQSSQQNTQAAAHLPSSWSINSKNPESWTPLLIPPKNAQEQEQVGQFFDQTLLTQVNAYIAQNPDELTLDQLTLLQKSFEGGPIDKSILDSHNKVLNVTTSVTQKTFGLPSTWSANSTTPEDWTPINDSIVGPANTKWAKTDMALKNVNDLMMALTGTMSALGIDQELSLDDQGMIVEDLNVATNAPPGTAVPPGATSTATRSESAINYFQTISQAIQSLRDQIRQMQLADGARTSKESGAKYDQIQTQKSLHDALADKMAKMNVLSQVMNGIGLSMKIAGPILSVLATVVGVIITVATGGIASPIGIALIVAGVALGAAATAYSIIDSCCNATSRIMTAIDKVIQSAFPDLSLLDVALIKFALIAVACIVAIGLVIALLVTGAGASIIANSVGGAIAQITKQLISKVIAMIVQSLLAVIQLLLGTNAMGDMISEICKEKNVDSKTAMTIQIVCTVVLMIGAFLFSMGAMAAANPGASTKDLQDMKKSIDETIKRLKADFFNELGKILKEIAATVTSTLKPPSINDIEGYFEGIDNDSIAMMMLVESTAKSAPQGATAAGKIANCYIHAEKAKLQHQLGDINAELEELQGLMKMLDRLIDQLMNIMNGRASEISGISDFMNNFFGQANKTMGGIEKALQG